MKAIQLEISGNWAQFRKSESDRNPLSHDLITKTAFIGMIGAVLGVERKDMKELFPVLCEDLLYGVQIVDNVNKQSWGFTLRRVGANKAPGQMEFLRSPKYIVVLALLNESSLDTFNQFANYCKNEKACYEPVLGLHNCPAEITFLKEGKLEKIANDTFETFGFVTNQHTMEDLSNLTFRLGFDNIPTYQNNDFWNLPERFANVIYPSEGNSIKVKGDYYKFDEHSNWCLL